MVVSVIGGETPQVAGAERADLSEPDRLLTNSLAMGLVPVRRRGADRRRGGAALDRDRQGPQLHLPPASRAIGGRLARHRRAGGAAAAAADRTADAQRPRPYLSAIDRIVEMTPEVIEIELTRPRPIC
ncbi:hypothetical protein AB5I41_29360 [Sphingomonas sp. MMS24-JH45]